MSSNGGITFTTVWTAAGIVVAFAVNVIVVRIGRESNMRSQGGIWWLPRADFVRYGILEVEGETLAVTVGSDTAPTPERFTEIADDRSVETDFKATGRVLSPDLARKYADPTSPWRLRTRTSSAAPAPRPRAGAAAACRWPARSPTPW